jgi:aspartyl protease family protein
MENQPNPHRKSGMLMLAVAWLLLFAGAYWVFDGWYQRQHNPNPQSLLMMQQGDLVLQRNREGQYVAEGTINGHQVTFLLDTGATQVALSATLANTLGLKPEGEVVVHTANGSAVGYQTRLNSVQLGPIEVHNVGALVTHGLHDESVLLGMSFLKQLEFTQRGNELTLKPLSSF